jgi:tetratricopeptide (TPR) repeat protein
MSIEFWTGAGEFATAHEEVAQARLIESLRDAFGASEGLVTVVFNFSCGEDLDMAVFKSDAIIVVELKDCTSPIRASENGEWQIIGGSIEGKSLRGGRHGNPFRQVKDYRFALIKYLEAHLGDFLPIQKASLVQFGHVSAIVAVSPDLDPGSQIDFDFGRLRWFHLVGLPKLPALIHDIRSNQIRLSGAEIHRLVQDVLKCTPLDTIPDSRRPRSSEHRGDVRYELPPIWRMPHRRNPNFTGRGDLLDELQKALCSSQHAALPHALLGLGGVGKTQIATEYAYRQSGDYDLVWWVRCEDAATLVEDYAALAGPLNLPEKDAKEHSLSVEAVRRWLERNDRWLLILDNAPDMAAIRDCLPRGGGGHTIITSRSAGWRCEAKDFTVRAFPRADSVALLCKRTDQTDAVAAGELAAALGDLPLALEQAGAYMEATGRSFTAYQDQFRTRHQELLNREPATDYPATVATTWEISFQAARQESAHAGDLLNLCAFLAPDDIPRDLLREAASKLPASQAALLGALTDDSFWDQAVTALRRYSLVEVSGDLLFVHRLVQAVARDRLSDEPRRAWAGAAAGLVNAAFPFHSDDVRIWPTCARLLSHALAAAGHAEALLLAPGAAGRLLCQSGLYLKGRAEFVQAKAAYERALAINEKVYGPLHPEVAVSLGGLGNVLGCLGDLDGASVALWRALAISERAYGPDHPNVATDLENLGVLLQELGDLPASRDALERALVIDEKAYGPDHSEVATDAANLGMLLKDLDDLAGAKVACLRALSIYEKTYGPDHPKVGTALNNLGNVLVALEDLTGAKAVFQRALAIDEKAYGPDHPDVATDVSNLGNVLHGQRDLAGAKAAFQRALSIDEKAYGPDHPEVAQDANNLGSTLWALGDLPGAKAAYERALAIDEKSYGSDHPHVAIVVNNLGTVLRDLDDLPGAEAAFERALGIDEKAYGPVHSTVAGEVNNLGTILSIQGDLAGARAAFQRALSVNEKAYGPDHPLVATNLSNLGRVLRDLDDLAGAKAAFRRALVIDEEAYGPDHPSVAIVVSDLGSILRDMGELAGAKAAFQRALTIDEKAYGPDHPKVATDSENLGTVLYLAGDRAGAKAAIQRALGIDEKTNGSDHPAVARDLDDLGVVLYAMGDLIGAKAAFQRALAIAENSYGPDHPEVASAVSNLGGVLHAQGNWAGAKAAFQRALTINEKSHGSEYLQVANDANSLGGALQAMGDLAGAGVAFERALAIYRRRLGEDHPSVVQVRHSLEMVRRRAQKKPNRHR